METGPGGRSRVAAQTAAAPASAPACASTRLHSCPTRSSTPLPTPARPSALRAVLVAARLTILTCTIFGRVEAHTVEFGRIPRYRQMSRTGSPVASATARGPECARRAAIAACPTPAGGWRSATRGQERDHVGPRLPRYLFVRIAELRQALPMPARPESFRARTTNRRCGSSRFVQRSAWLLRGPPGGQWRQPRTPRFIRRLNRRGE